MVPPDDPTDFSAWSLPPGPRPYDAMVDGRIT
jgi:hypothetical protein